MSNRVDVATFFIDELNESIDIEDSDGCSPRNMAMKPGAQMMSDVAPRVVRAAMQQVCREKKQSATWCAKCGVA